MIKRQLGAFGSLAQRLVQCLYPAPGVSCFRKPEETAFGLFNNIRSAALMLQPRIIGIPQDLLTQRDQLAAPIQVIDRTALILGIDDRDHAGGKIGEIFRAADRRKIAVLFEIILQGDRTGQLAALDQFEDCLIQVLMYGTEKMERAQKIADLFQCSVIKHQRA
jgi:hypothetical protein